MSGPLHTAAGVADAAVSMMGTALVHGTVLAVAAWVLSITLLRRARPAAIVALWTVVLLKFLVPIGPGARYSLASLVAGVTADEIKPAEIVVVQAPAPGTRLAPRRAPALPWGALAATAGWLTIAGALTIRQIRRARAARVRALTADAAPAWLAAETTALAHRLGLRRRVVSRLTVRVGGADTASYLVGLVEPIIVVPASLAAADQVETRRAVLAHELAHVRRGDAALRLVQAAAATLFFFWPVVRLVNRRIDLAREQACDAWAVAVGPLSARAYARMLIDAARAAHGAPVAGLAFVRRGGQLRRRVDALCDRTPGAGVGVAGAVAVAGFAALGLTGAARADAAPPRAKVCIFTPEVASSIMDSFPEADVDGDGFLSRTEVCEFQTELRRRAVEDTLTFDLTDATVLASVLDEASPLASDELCCNCPDPAAASGGISTSTVDVSTAIPTCSRGVDP